MENTLDRRVKRAWSFFLENAGALVVASLLVCLGTVLVIPGPWMTINLLGEISAALREGRRVRWQATYDRTSTFLPAWGLTLGAGICIAIGLGLCVIPGILLALTWLHAPVMVADGKPVLHALRESPRRLHTPEQWIDALLDACVLLACALAASLTAVLTVVALPVALAYLALCASESSHGPIAQRIEPIDATA